MEVSPDATAPACPRRCTRLRLQHLEQRIPASFGEAAAAVGLTGRKTLKSFMGWVKLMFKYLYFMNFRHLKLQSERFQKTNVFA